MNAHARMISPANQFSSLRPLVRLSLLLLLACSAPAQLRGEKPRPERQREPFIIGADISWVPEDEAAGATYYDQGERRDIFQILKSHGFNYIRLRIFVDPKSEIGYARNMTEPFCDLPHTLAMAKRIKSAGMGFLLDFHYSDNWADPQKQIKPAAWENLTFPDLIKAVHDHTSEVISALEKTGTAPDMVQIGNEIRPGMLWPDGRVGKTRNAESESLQWDNLAALLKSGIAAVREIDPNIAIVLHNDAGYSNSAMRYWLDQLLKRDVKFDIIGMSCYREDQEGDWSRDFNDLAIRYPDHRLLVCEYSARKRYLNDAIFNAPNSKGIGSFIWEPTRHKEAIFDLNGRNAGGGEAFNYNATAPSNRPATRPAARPATGAGVNSAGANSAGATTRPTTRRRNFGGRYDTNALIDLYPQMATDYAAK